MKRVLIAVLLALVCLPPAFAAAPPKVGAKAAIEAVEKEFVAAWNAHDAKRLAAVWAPDGDLINPFGRVAKGRAELEKLLTEEQSTVFKTSTYQIESESIREIARGVAIADWESVVTGMVGPDGKPAPPLKHHVTVVYRLAEGHWQAVAARPVIYAPPPGGPAH